MTIEEIAQEIYETCEATEADPYEALDALGVDEAQQEEALAAYEALLSGEG